MMDLNDGRFMQNGGSGYVLKPAIMREEIAYFSANTRDVIPGVSPQILHIKVHISLFHQSTLWYFFYHQYVNMYCMFSIKG